MVWRGILVELCRGRRRRKGMLWRGFICMKRERMDARNVEVGFTCYFLVGRYLGVGAIERI